MPTDPSQFRVGVDLLPVPDGLHVTSAGTMARVSLSVATTVLLNVIAQDIFYGVLEGALRAAIVYQLLTIIILWLNRAHVLRIWHAFLAPEPTNHSIRWYWLAAGAAVVLAISLQLEFWITH